MEQVSGLTTQDLAPPLLYVPNHETLPTKITGGLPLNCPARSLPIAILSLWIVSQQWLYAAPPGPEHRAIAWQTDYGKAMGDADAQKKMLLIFFFDPSDEAARRFETEVLGDADVCARLKKNFLCVRLPLDAHIDSEHKEVTLLKHAAFSEMLGRPGVAIVDLAHADAALHGNVVSEFPLTSSLSYTPQQMRVILDLPPGTLTQRTMIYAVRIHPEHPASTDGQLEPHLVQEVQSHSENQARMRLQGHHWWETRFHRINAILSPGLTAKEVCAESWPGQRLVDAAIECVRCWRCSDGHWSAVRAAQCCYAYDMKCGDNGVWYATGIFGCR
jgi:hypothetical protein